MKHQTKSSTVGVHLGLLHITVLILLLLSSVSLVAQPSAWQAMNNVVGFDSPPSGIVDNDGVLYGIRNEYLCRSLDSSKTWQALGDTTTRISSPILQTDHRIYVLTNKGGIFYRTNSDTSLRSCMSNLASAHAQAFSVQDSLLYACVSNELYKSTNRGASWTLTYRSSYYLRNVSVCNDVAFMVINDVLNCSLDSGASWMQMFPGFVYNESSRFFSAFNTIYCVGGGNGLDKQLRTFNRQSRSWSLVDMPVLSKYSSVNYPNTKLSLFRVDNRLLLSFDIDSIYFEHPFVVVSDDQGKSWQKLVCPTLYAASPYFFGSCGTSLVYNTNAVYFTSIDLGATWKQGFANLQNESPLLSVFSDGYQYYLGLCAKNSFYVLENGRSYSGQSSWQKFAEIPGSSTNVTYFQSNSDFYGVNTNGLISCMSDASLYYSPSYKVGSTDKIKDFKRIAPIIASPLRCFKVCQGTSLNPNSPMVVFIASENKLYYSEDSMKTWQSYVFADKDIVINDIISVIWLVGSETQRNYLVATNKGVFRCHGNSHFQSWEALGLSDFDVYTLAYNQKAYSGSQYIYAGTDNGLYRLPLFKPLGWIECGPSATPVKQIAVASYENLVFIGAEPRSILGAMIPDTGRIRWKQVNTDLPKADVISLTFLGDDNSYFFCSLEGHGAFVAHTGELFKDITAISEAKSSTAFELRPNPASQALHLHFPTLAVDTRVQLFSLCSELMLSTTVEAGSSECSLDVSSLPIGTYALSFSNLQGIQTRVVSVVH